MARQRERDVVVSKAAEKLGSALESLIKTLGVDQGENVAIAIVAEYAAMYRCTSTLH